MGSTARRKSRATALTTVESMSSFCALCSACSARLACVVSRTRTDTEVTSAPSKMGPTMFEVH